MKTLYFICAIMLIFALLNGIYITKPKEKKKKEYEKIKTEDIFF